MTATLATPDNQVMPPRRAQRPAERVEADLRARLAAGEWGHGDALPTVTELAAHYATGKGTVTKVLRRLAADGLVTIVPRWGTFRA